jgi:S1-C subfamily serine protease
VPLKLESALRLPFVVLLCAFTVAAAAPVFGQSNSAISYDATRNVFTMAPIIQGVTPGVVSISTVMSEEADGTTVGGIGSGVIIDAEKGLILTNDHVIADAQSMSIILSDKRRYAASILGQDSETDLALLRITAEDLTALPISMSDDVMVGDLVIAVGNPFGLSHSVSTGIVSAIGRTDDNPLGYSDLIQTDAAINPGNSGGALVNSAGELIGINSAIVAKDRGSSGIGFAIPSHTFRAVADQLETYGVVSRGSLGVMISPVTQEVQARLDLDDLDGAHIVEVTRGGAASEGGLRVDDIVTHFGERVIGNSSDLRYAVGLVRPNTGVFVTYIRDGKSSESVVIVRGQDYIKTADFNSVLAPVLQSDGLEN